MPLDVRLVENEGVEGHVENEEEDQSEADQEADMGAAEVGAAAADAAQVHGGLIGGGGRMRLWRPDEAEAVLVVEAIAAAVIVLGVHVGLVEGRGEVLARGHRCAEALCVVRRRVSLSLAVRDQSVGAGDQTCKEPFIKDVRTEEGGGWSSKRHRGREAT